MFILEEIIVENDNVEEGSHGDWLAMNILISQYLVLQVDGKTALHHEQRH